MPARCLGVAVSGGGDSVALLRILHSLKPAQNLDLHVFHVDHGWRPDSRRDAAWVGRLARRLALPFHQCRLNPPAGGFGRFGGREAWARRHRLAALAQMAAATGVDAVVLGHTAEDQAETVLIRILRGTSIRGLGGMRPLRTVMAGGRRLTLWRPLLETGRERLRQALGEIGQRWREDPTNTDQTFLRNRVRHQLLPLLNATRPGAAAHLRALAGDARQVSALLTSRYRRGLPATGSDIFPLVGVADPDFILRERLRIWLSRAGAGARISRALLTRLLDLARKGQCGRRVTVGKRVVVRVAEGLALVVPSGSPCPPAVPLVLDAPVAAGDGRVYLASSPLQPEHEGSWVPRDLAGQGLTLRGRRPADRFRPAGGRGGKKLARWLIDRKIPREQRASLSVVARGSEVIWIPGLSRSDRTSLEPYPDRVFLGRYPSSGTTSPKRRKAPGTGA